MATDALVTHEAELGYHLQLQFAAALASVSDAVIATDAAQHVAYLNPAAESMTGWLAVDAIGKPLDHVFRPVDGQSSGEDSAPATASPGDPPVQATLVDSHGFRTAIEYRLVLVRDGGGRVVGTVAVARDLTRRRAAEFALLANERSLLANADALFAERERAQVTLNSIGDAVISTDFRGVVTFLNSVAEVMTGWAQSEAAGEPLDRVFVLVDASSRRTIACPTTRAIIENRKVAVGLPCVLVRRDGAELAVESSAAPIHDRHGGVIGAVMVAHDVTAARELSGKLARLALHDSLTDLPNRTLFSERMAEAMLRARTTGSSVALLYVDLDRFKQINDSLGHNVGDLLLQGVAKKLLSCVRSSDTVSRLGGDEFVLVLAEVHDADDAARCAEKILNALSSGFTIGDLQLNVTASIGIAMFPGHASDADTLLRHADAAMYRAKYTGRASYQLFTAEVNSIIAQPGS
jgi:diguanylate cyclase (GGDEF)-like protein/PAS domain S-box-containing protein